MSGRDDKNIDSTDNVKRGQKPLSLKKSGRRRPNLPHEGVKKFSFFI